MTGTIGFVGTGNMGLPMAANLVDAGHSLRVYNRTASKVAPLAAKGAVAVSSPAETAAEGGIVITMLADDRALESVAADDFARRLGAGGIHVSMSTVSPEMARKVAQHHGRFGVAYVAAPVFGRPEAAAARKLWICVSGAAAAKERVKPILGALGQGVFDMGDNPAAAHVMKLVGNFWIMSAIESMAEGLALAEKNGLDPAKAVEMLTQTLFACTIYQNYGRMVLARRFEPAGFRLELGLKDIDLVLKTAASSTVAMPAASLLHDRMVAGVAKGRAHLDWTAVVLDILADAGLKPAAAIS